MQLLVAGLLIFFSRHAPTSALPCDQVTSSECSRDEALISYEGSLENEELCIALCQTYSSVPTLGCTFASWESLDGPFGHCILYKSPETFASYISHCNKLSGPKNVSGCSVETPEDSTCDVIRQGECVLQGNPLPPGDQRVDNWAICQTFCQSGAFGDCKAWLFDKTQSLCSLYDSADQVCTRSYTPSGVDLAGCEDDSPTSACDEFIVDSCSPDPSQTLNSVNLPNTGLQTEQCQRLCTEQGSLQVPCAYWSISCPENPVYPCTCTFYQSSYLHSCQKVGGDKDVAAEICLGQIAGDCGDLVEEDCLLSNAPVWTGAADSADDCLYDLTDLWGPTYGAHYFLYDNDNTCSLFTSGARTCNTISGPRGDLVENCL